MAYAKHPGLGIHGEQMLKGVGFHEIPVRTCSLHKAWRRWISDNWSIRGWFVNSEFYYCKWVASLTCVTWVVGIQLGYWSWLEKRVYRVEAKCICKENTWKADMGACKPVKYLMEFKVKLNKDKQGKTVNSTLFKIIIGGLRYLMHIRPDIA